MASTTVYNAFKAFLQGQFPGGYPVLDFDQIEPAMEQGTAPFLVIEEMPATETVAAMGDPNNLCMRASGIVLVYAFTPAPQSSSAARAIGDQIANAMRLVEFGSQIRVLGVDPPDIQLANNGLWTIAAVPVNVEHDFYVARP